MSHHHYKDVIDPDTGKTLEETNEKKNMVHHYDDGPDIKATNKKIQEKQREIDKLQKEKERLEKAEEVKNKEALALSEKLHELKTQRNKINSDIIQTQKKLYKLCTHEKVKTKSRTIPGGYLNQREYITEFWCELCGIKVDEKVKYGGFE